ncbi:YoaK family protein [Thermopolyspora sp. NPDC052614]|uniref:YoaK family protein n=1 Tax=Thermopolyspora sp. NPDC052614 TaxID=3155682 RepID=UPI00342C080B
MPETRRPSPLTVALVLLTAVTGVVEAVSFLGLGLVFTAIMTGNTLFLGFVLADAVLPETALPDAGLPVAGPAVALVAFAVGAFAGNHANEALVGRAGDGWLPLAMYGEGVLLAVAALLALGLPPGAAHLSPHRFTVIILVSATMGARNVTILRARARDLPTTVVTRSLAGALMAVPAQTRARRFATPVAMCIGAAVGALLLSLHPAVPLLAASAAAAAAGALCARETSRS